MKILIAEDDPISRRILTETLSKWNYEVIVTSDGVEALEALQSAGAPRLAILDWMMPGLAGPDICARLREPGSTPPPYLMLLSAQGGQADTSARLQPADEA